MSTDTRREQAIEAGAKAYHASNRASYMRVAGYGSIQPWEEMPESSREAVRENFRAGLAAYEQRLVEGADNGR